MDNVLELAKIIVPSITALSIYLMNRRQTLHLEARKLDPTLPIKAPPLPIWGWLLRRAYFIGAGYSVVDLTLTMIHTSTVTKWTVFSIALNMSNIVLSLVAYLIDRISDYSSWGFSTLFKSFEAIATLMMLLNSSEPRPDLVERVKKQIAEINAKQL